MSANKEVVKTEKKPITICYRNIKKEFNKFEGAGEPISPQYHLELDEKNAVKKVQDRNRDWAELADKDVNQVGLANILRLMSKGQMSFGQTMFKDDEAIDTSVIPDDVSTLSGKDPTKKLEVLATKLGVSVDDLIQAFMNGGLNDLIETKLNEKKESEVTKNGESTESNS